MTTVGLLVNTTKPAALEAARVVAARLASLGIPALALDSVAAELYQAGCRTVPDGEHLARESDFVLVFGGDGTFLSAARLIAPFDTPLLGVHLGHFGFLTEVAPENLLSSLEQVLAGEGRVEVRSMLEGTVYRNGASDPAECESLVGMNDVVIASGAVRMVHVRTTIGGADVATYAADGVIVASPTGSTGYSLSAGGPLVHPTAPVFVVTPICPHTLNARALIVPDTETVELSIEANRPDTSGVVSVDGQIELPLAAGDRVVVRRAPHSVRLLRLGGPTFYQKIRDRWRYGERSAP